jgi:hypothetical protein
MAPLPAFVDPQFPNENPAFWTEALNSNLRKSSVQAFDSGFILRRKNEKYRIMLRHSPNFSGVTPDLGLIWFQVPSKKRGDTMNKGKKLVTALLLVMGSSQIACLGGGQQADTEEEIMADQAADLSPEEYQKKAEANAQSLSSDLAVNVDEKSDAGTETVVALDPTLLDENTATAGTREGEPLK